MSDIDDCRKSVERLTRDRGEVMREGNDKIAEIRARHSRDERWRNSPSMICPQAHEDRALLLAEDERHRAEIERLREAIRTSRARCVELELKNESLSAAADHAGAALAAAIELLERGREDAPSKRMFSQMLADYRVIVARTRKALEGKP